MYRIILILTIFLTGCVHNVNIVYDSHISNDPLISSFQTVFINQDGNSIPEEVIKSWISGYGSRDIDGLCEYIMNIERRHSGGGFLKDRLDRVKLVYKSKENK